MIPDIYKDRYFINGTSLYNGWSVIVEKGGYEELMREPQRKYNYVHVWGDQNGTDRYVEPYFETRTVTLNFVFLCENLQDYLTKHDDLFSILKSGEYISLQVPTLGKKWRLLYDNEISVDNLTDIYRGGMAIVKHTLRFLDDNTTSSIFIPEAFLTDENGVFLTDENDEFLTIDL